LLHPEIDLGPKLLLLGLDDSGEEGMIPPFSPITMAISNDLHLLKEVEVL
jgi:hypothetical protein